jgi:hypothetical protein
MAVAYAVFERVAHLGGETAFRACGCSGLTVRTGARGGGFVSLG